MMNFGGTVMKDIHKIIMIIVCLLMLLVSCTQPKSEPSPDTLPSVTTETIPPAEEQAHYKWVMEPALNGDIRPVCSVLTNDICSMGLFFWKDGDSYKLIDSLGEVKTELNTDGYGYGYCDICGAITDHTRRLNIETYAPEGYSYGHDSPDNSPLIYDVETDKVYVSYIGGYTLVEKLPDTVIVSLCTRVPLDEVDIIWSEVDYRYENTHGYGILVNGVLVLRGCEMYSRYSNGITAMRIDGKWGYYDTEGNSILPCEYQPSTQQLYNSLYENEYIPYQASYGILALNRNGKWGYADTEGNMLTEFEFEEAIPVYKNLGWVKTNDGWGIIELDYSYTGIEDIEVIDMLAEQYGLNTSPELVKHTVNLSLFETELRVFLVNGEDRYYVTDDGHIIHIF